jgi:hypothetical protein
MGFVAQVIGHEVHLLGGERQMLPRQTKRTPVGMGGS